MRAVANCVTSHSTRFGDQMPNRSPRCRPSAARPAAKRSTCSELRPGPAHVLLAEHDGGPVGEARRRVGEQRGDRGGRQRHAGRACTCDMPSCGAMPRRGLVCSAMLVSVRRSLLAVERSGVRGQLRSHGGACLATVVADRASAVQTAKTMPAAVPARRAPRIVRAATPIAFVKAVLLGYAKYGIDPSDALREARIAPALLRQASACITASQFETLCGVAMQQLDDEALGWFSRRLPWGSYGMLCRASLSSPDLGVALKRWCRHHQLLVDDVLLTLRVAGQRADMTIEECRPIDSRLREFCLLTLLRYVHGFACWAIDSRIRLLAASFPHPPPVHHAAYALLFPGPVCFNAAAAGISFDAQYPSLPLRRDEAALRIMLRRRCRSRYCNTGAIGCSCDARASCCPHTRRPTRWRQPSTCPCARCIGSSRTKALHCRH